MNNIFFRKWLIISIFSIAISTIFFSCAQIGSIDGGDKDTSAPQMRKARPYPYTGNYDGKKTMIKFDEFYSLDNIESKFLMSPPHDSLKPKIKVRGKKLIVKFKEDLKPDTTYTLQFFDAIKDYNEGNVLKGFEYVFSTGDIVDTFAISGFVFDAQTLEKEKDILVGIYGTHQDSVVIKSKPDYITRTDTAGYFSINNIRPGQYKIFALGDINETQKFDLENEKIGFLKTLITPKAERLRKEDSLKAGTILHLGTYGHPILDTLKTDSVIVQDILYTTPNNIHIYTFNEIKEIQYISERSRDLRNRATIVFNKKIEDTVIITHIDDTLTQPNIYFEYNHSRDTMTLWLKDTADINNDTLQLRVTYTTLDSLRNITTETDTIPLKYVVKKSKKKDKNAKEKPKNIDSLNFTINSSLASENDIDKNITINIPIPTEKIDTSLIKIYQLQDSSFTDDMNQKLLKAVRHDSTHFRLVFKQPILGNIVFYPTDSIVRPDWYTAQYSTNRDTVDIEVIDTCMAKRTKFPNILKHWNQYYLGQIQKLRDSVPTTIVAQKILNYSRPSRDSIIVKLEKNPRQGVEISAINITPSTENWFQTTQNNDKITILLLDTAATNKDTLALKFNTFDRWVYNKYKLKTVASTLKDTLFAIFKPMYQVLKSKTRPTKDSLIFVFERQLNQIPTLSPIDNTQLQNNWYSTSLTQSKDTLIVALNNLATSIDTLNFSISYQNIDRFNNPLTQIDTLSLIKPKEKDIAENDNQTNRRRRKSDIGMETQKEKEKAKQNMYQAKLKFPVEYEILPDTMNAKNIVIKFERIPGKEYELMVDDSAFTSIFNTPNLYLSSKGKIRTEDYYGQLKINIINCGNIERYPDIDEDIEPFKQPDTARIKLRKAPIEIDSTPGQYTKLKQGQLLICLTTDKGEIKYQKEISQDGTVTFDYIVPADYKLRIIHDINSNKQWDTGEYLEGLYPERVIDNPNKQTIKSKWTTECTWKL